VTTPDLTRLIDEYRSGLEAEIAILRQLEEVADRQHAASSARDVEALRQAADQRDRLMSALVTIEQQLRSVRQALSEVKDQVKRLPGYQEAVELHRTAIALVGGILRTDSASLEALAAAELARRDLARALEQGETTLAAYRRVMMAPPGATLVDRRG
jgi:uncharacterized protein YhaN